MVSRNLYIAPISYSLCQVVAFYILQKGELANLFLVQIFYIFLINNEDESDTFLNIRHTMNSRHPIMFTAKAFTFIHCIVQSSSIQVPIQRLLNCWSYLRVPTQL